MKYRMPIFPKPFLCPHSHLVIVSCNVAATLRVTERNCLELLRVPVANLMGLMLLPK